MRGEISNARGANGAAGCASQNGRGHASDAPVRHRAELAKWRGGRSRAGAGGSGEGLDGTWYKDDRATDVASHGNCGKPLSDAHAPPWPHPPQPVSAHDARSDMRREDVARVASTARTYERRNAVIVMATRCCERDVMCTSGGIEEGLLTRIMG